MMPGRVLVPQSQFLDELPVSVDVRALHVVEEATASSDHLEEATTAVVVLFVGAEMVVQIVDAIGEDRDLNAGGTAVRLVRAVLFDGRCFVEGHCDSGFPAEWRCAGRFSSSL